jgi:hypothetical protein
MTGMAGMHQALERDAAAGSLWSYRMSET